MGLGATIITVNPSTIIKSADANSNWGALNGAANPSFNGVTLNTPPVLAGGNQDTGRWSCQFDSAPGANRIGNSTTFRVKMTNTPTSITFTVSNSFNVTGPSISTLTTDGFDAYVVCNHTGGNNGGWWYGAYATVGNCLLAVDAAARTFDHHCDVCRHIALDVPFADLTINTCDTPVLQGWRGLWKRLWKRVTRTLWLTPDAFDFFALDTRPHFVPGRSSLSYRCRDCGAVECFNTALSAADEQDTTVMANVRSTYRVTYGEQAARIRALQRALGYPVVEDVVVATSLAPAAV